MAELNFKSAFELTALIRKRELKPSEAVAHALARVEALNGKLNAFCAMRAEQAMAEARAMDERVARREEVGALAGVPIGVKDLEEVAGMATTFGSKAFRDNLAAEDAIEVARLRAAGAIVIGKTNTPEFGHSAFTRNLLFGLTRNPWNLERTPGGSSGGSAAAVASGMVPIATASDAGGSIRLPAAYTGCVGLKPSHGRIPAGPRMGMESFNGISSVGPIARTVADAALFLDVACGYHAADPDSLPHPGISYLATLERLPARLRVAFHPDFGHAVEREVLRAAENAAGAFRELGCVVEVIEGPVPETAGAWTIGARGAASGAACRRPAAASRGDEPLVRRLYRGGGENRMARIRRGAARARRVQRLGAPHLRALRFVADPRECHGGVCRQWATADGNRGAAPARPAGGAGVHLPVQLKRPSGNRRARRDDARAACRAEFKSSPNAIATTSCSRRRMPTSGCGRGIKAGLNCEDTAASERGGVTRMPVSGAADAADENFRTKRAPSPTACRESRRCARALP